MSGFTIKALQVGPLKFPRLFLVIYQKLLETHFSERLQNQKRSPFLSTLQNLHAYSWNKTSNKLQRVDSNTTVCTTPIQKLQTMQNSTFLSSFIWWKTLTNARHVMLPRGYTMNVWNTFGNYLIVLQDVGRMTSGRPHNQNPMTKQFTYANVSFSVR